MEPIYLSIQQKETGSRIKSLLRESGYTVRDIQNAMGFENPQAVYKWISGKCLPSLDNFLILSRLTQASKISSSLTGIFLVSEANTEKSEKD